MTDTDLTFPDWSGHPPPPRLSFEEYEAWILKEILPALHAEGKMSVPYLRKQFDQNEGRMTEPFRL